MPAEPALAADSTATEDTRTMAQRMAVGDLYIADDPELA